MICLKCKGPGTLWVNNILIDCPRCSGKGEERKNPRNIPTYINPKDD